MQRIQLIDSRPRLDLRVVLGFLFLAGATVASALWAGQMLDLEQQVLSLVVLGILLLTIFVAVYDLTNAIILWFFALTLVGRYTQLNLPGIPDMSGPRFMLVLMWAVFLIEIVLRRRRPLPLTRIEALMLVYMGVNLGNMMYSGSLVHTATRVSPITPFVNFVAFPFSIYYLVRNACAGDASTRKMWKAMAVLQVYLALTGIFEHYRIKWLVFPPDILDPTAGLGRWYGSRIRGPYLHSPIYGAVMGMGFFLLFHLYNYTRGRWRLPMLVGLLATPLACFYTLTRQVWLGLVLPMLLGPILSRRQRVMMGLLVLAALTFISVVDWEAIADPKVVRLRATDQATGEARLAHFVVGWQMFADKPVFGHGLLHWQDNWESYRRRAGSFQYLLGKVDIGKAHGIDAHNTFLRIAVELGLAGLVPFVLILWFIFRASVHLFRRSQPQGFFGRELVLSFWQLALAFFVCINFVDPSTGEFLPGYFFAFAAIVVRRAELAAGAARTTAVESATSFGEQG